MSYFNCLVIFSLIVVFMVEIYFNPFNNEKNPFGSATSIYEFVNCWPGPLGLINMEPGIFPMSCSFED